MDREMNEFLQRKWKWKEAGSYSCTVIQSRPQSPVHREPLQETHGESLTKASQSPHVNISENLLADP